MLVLGDCHFIAPLIFGVTGVPFNPVKAAVMIIEQLKQLLEQLDVLRRLFIRFAPAVRTPFFRPALGYRIDNIFAVGGDDYLARLF